MKNSSGSLKPVNILTAHCVYDLNNPRIEPLRDEIDYKGNPKQKRANIRAIIAARDCEGPTSTSYKGLKKSISKVGIRNPIEVVKQRSGYLVTSGNTRLCIFEDLARENPHDRRWQSIPARIMPSSNQKEKEISTITEHLCRGRDWPAQATAQKIYDLLKNETFSPESLAEMTGQSVERLLLQKDAYDDFQIYEKPLRKKYGKRSRTDQFSIWVEVQDASLSRALKKLAYKNHKGQMALARLIIDERFTSANHIRKLPRIVDNKSSLAALCNDNSDEAIKVLEQNEIKSMNMLDLIDALHKEWTNWHAKNKHIKRRLLLNTNEFRSMKSFYDGIKVFFK